MRLTHWTDYSLRVLMYCAACTQREKPATISEIAGAHGISRSHLTKIVMTLSGLGLLETTRGRGGGLRLLKPAHLIVLGDVVRQTETDFTLVECFSDEHNTCRLEGYCRLKGTLQKAMDRYLAELDGVTLADLLEPMPPGAGVRKVVHLKHIPGMPDL
ncbi:MAG: Rrf2 family transcriptional regulator [Burkholderiales bacterium RIFCSPLOWO2_12_67_14]|nr:MAG: Rrf2 family transcriptional regulator [Burkholderiales bacterium RIFCSPLOWO2_02_FULL_67_64]OGB46707.1 MAG: Rrf2 family transcriptional regulator [Burkholderiales bacterium RIFCSPLOWO2_12_67_14]OGB49548.1 MAG: Rrf2 family transcriptional regulator [Burkholderiales bacterium RIFCSPHIGHO2_12_FULL_67_38]